MDLSPCAVDGPRVSVGIPLYKSRRFLDNIIDNLEAITYKNIEIIISDRHCLDNTIDLLYDRYGDDPRFEFNKRVDQINWVDHYNFLLRQFTGKYFLWMPHDDIYPDNYIPALVSCLEEQPDAVCAFGRYEAIDLAGSPLPFFVFTPPPIISKGRWTLYSAMKLLHWQPSKAFRGLFRRDVIAESAFFIRPTHETFAADDCWIFGLSLKGRFCFVSDCSCRKRYYLTSTSAQLRVGMRHWINYFLVLRSYLKYGCSGRLELQRGTVHIFLRCTYLFLKTMLSLILPSFIKDPIKKLRCRMSIKAAS